jgi:hypothetical protein
LRLLSLYLHTSPEQDSQALVRKRREIRHCVANEMKLIGIGVIMDSDITGARLFPLSKDLDEV